MMMMMMMTMTMTMMMTMMTLCLLCLWLRGLSFVVVVPGSRRRRDGSFVP
jgi:hypothetical protein